MPLGGNLLVSQQKTIYVVSGLRSCKHFKQASDSLGQKNGGIAFETKVGKMVLSSGSSIDNHVGDTPLLGCSRDGSGGFHFQRGSN